MNPAEKEKLKHPWGGLGYLILIIVAFLASYFLLWPIGKTVGSVFQRITNALEHKS